MLKKKPHSLGGTIILLGCVLGSLTWAQAEVKLPAIFGDHMVLQQEAKLPIWGTDTLGKESGTSTAEPVTLTGAGKNTLSYQDVLVRDVWICSDQSNMAFNLGRCSTAADDLPKASEPNLRIFKVRIAAAIDPLTEVLGSWQVCSPDVTTDFSAVG